ncbi:polysaccharide deacetylase family protein [Aspergillus candidus]|uniref:Glucose 1-dehydrogenase n=1 Tax=Aspergillus candidus TaxID=41067 RepID=A0A2I2FEU2_ASPCN|nr:glucose 1-dehydrogenase [Aspergillus candidus]PLB39135.1 glucose 1-dehydrogenase [Aspergillus candidus]
MGKRVLVGYGIDVDAVSGWINSENGSAPDLTDMSRGIFGATVGIDRLLKLLDRNNIKASWFVPGHSIESFPDQIQKIRDANHEIGLHGYSHEHVNALSEQQEREVLARSIEVVTTFTGKRPRGWTAPSWKTSPRSIKLLEEAGLEYDHSYMHHDSQLYYVPQFPEDIKTTDLSKQAPSWMVPMGQLTTSKIVEVPANWHLDDWPPFQLEDGPSHGYVDPHVIERLWKDQFDFLYSEYETFVFPISIHPQVSGKPQVLLLHQRLIDYLNAHEGVEWCTFGEMVDEFKAGRIGGVQITGGVGS